MESLFAHCADALTHQRPLFFAFFLAGLTGGFTHCLSMCGPFVACERMCGAKACGAAGKGRRNGMSLTYHLGRLTTYGALGFVAALLSRQVVVYAWWPLLSSALLATAGGLFLLSFLKACKHGETAPEAPKLGYLRGVLLGFMPCGLLYAALMMAATLANPFSGMLAMWLFTLGTVPALVMVSSGAIFLTRHWQRQMHRLGCAMMAFNGLSLLAMAATVVR